MTVKHHLTEPLLMAYAAGTLPEAFDLVVASHVSLCDSCRAAVEGFEALGGAVLEDMTEDLDLSDASLEATMALIAAGPAEEPAPIAVRDPVLPGPLVQYVGGGLDAVKWRSLGRGVKQAILPTGSDEATARLLYIPAGMAMPEHGHGGMELTLVLQGAFADEDDRFARGDVEIGTEDMEHTPVAEMGADCICLAATTAPLQFKGLVPRMLQPIFRI
ncbi:ChrR family anti-sigma-E factor [Oceanomicrobium pacificus]|uniref:Transcriptional regulator n=1 Tax=Oceanomicrobium pacificus TaxID=2692916 RepID=A0A6B0TNM1_9RHOB|nr:ChrR family anti-sigma-E factor [Oceanomicrobium pacificus]MXU66210.1 transcriptional regulator [Oceanomicrobium pacificus]